jgi:hypothetical protein
MSDATGGDRDPAPIVLSPVDLVVEDHVGDIALTIFAFVVIAGLAASFLPSPWNWIVPLMVLAPPLIMMAATPRSRAWAGRILSAVAVAMRVIAQHLRGWWARRKQRWGAALYALRRWLRLAVGKKEPEALAEMASVQGFLAATPLSPFRLIATIAGGAAALFASLWGWAANVTIPDLEKKLTAQTALASEAIDANAGLAARIQAAETAAEQARAQLTTHRNAVLAETDAAARRAQARTAARMRTLSKQAEILDAGRRTDDAEPFDGERWLRERAARADQDSPVPGVSGAGAAAAAADRVPDGARAHAAGDGERAPQPR